MSVVEVGEAIVAAMKSRPGGLDHTMAAASPCSAVVAAMKSRPGGLDHRSLDSVPLTWGNTEHCERWGTARLSLSIRLSMNAATPYPPWCERSPGKPVAPERSLVVIRRSSDRAQREAKAGFP